jgi:predicted DNA-binding transcriptional regulator AlpA
MTHHLVGVTEIAEMLGLSRQRADQLSRNKGFPDPEVELSGGRIWRRDKVERWARKRARPSWTKTVSTWSDRNTVGLGNGRVLYLIASVARADNGWSWAVDTHKHGTQKLASGIAPTEREARIVAINELCSRDEYGSCNGPPERRHFAHMGENACGSPIEAAAPRFATTTCADCLDAMGRLT